MVLSRLHPSRLLTIHNLAWEAGVVGWFVSQSLLASPTLAGVFLASGVLVSLLLRSVAPIPTFQPVGGSYCVGVRHIPGDASKNLPPMAAYYPTHIPPNHQDPEPWVPHDGDTRYLRGLSSYGELPFVLFRHWSLVGMRCTRNAAVIPLWNATTQTMRPWVVFSHGLAGHCRLYSLLAMDMAARGAIVIVPEHQDGSSCFTRDVHNLSDDACTPLKPCPAPSGTPQERQFREEQLNHRVKEVEAVLRTIVSGDMFHSLCLSQQDIQDVAERCPGGVPQVALVGHSFGGATVLATAVNLCTQQPPDETLKGLHVHAVTTFDAWHLPIQYTTLAKIRELCRHDDTSRKGGSVSRRLPPLLLLESEEWECWPPSTRFQRELIAAYQQASDAAAAGPQFGTSNNDTVPSVSREVTYGTDHMSCCDIAALSPVLSRKKTSKVKPRQQITNWARRVLQHIAMAASEEGATLSMQQIASQGTNKTTL